MKQFPRIVNKIISHIKLLLPASILNWWGFRLDRYIFPPPTSVIRNPYHSLAFLKKKMGVSPKTVFDIGVFKGTPWLYESFPKTHFVLVEANPDLRKYLEKIKENLSATIKIVAVSNYNGYATFNKNIDPGKSSLLKRNKNQEVGIQQKVAVTTIDSIIENHNFSHPFLIKMDIEGGELQALKGASKALCLTDVVILEILISQLNSEFPRAEEVINYMFKNNFVIFDIVTVAYNKRGLLNGVNLIFIKRDFLEKVEKTI